MGKVQSKHGECFLVNAHFNPLCQTDEDVNRLKTVNYVNRDKNSSSSGLSLSLTGDILQHQVECELGKTENLQVNLQSEALLSELANKYSMEDKPEKAQEEKSEKEERTELSMNEVSCDLSVSDLEKQEFSFTLYNFNGHGNVTKDDVAGLVRSIHETLGKSVKLPPSGSRTIKVRLAISPDSTSPAEKEAPQPSKSTTQKETDNIKTPMNEYKQCSNQSVNTCSTYLSFSSPEKENSKFKCHNSSPVTNNLLTTTTETKPTGCNPATPKSQRGCRSSSLQRQEVIQESVEKSCLDCAEENRRQPGEKHWHKRRHRHHRSCRNHITECCDRYNHYLNLDGDEKLPYESRYSFSYGLSEKNHLDSRMPYHQEVTENHCNKKLGHCSHQRSKSHDANTTARLFHYRMFSDQKDDFLNLNFDLCDLLPEEKFDWERQLPHRRSKSYDVHDHSKSNFLNSPKAKQRTNRGVTFTASAAGASPNHHHKQKHRERERMRTMQQVADWLKKEHLGEMSKEDSISNSQVVIQRHEHHHFHEHVHHHYHHYIPS
ncbi:uncharacterized protein LOC143250874 isoform X1 [Tachypleus tridentatus]|uniref:uncharacterized protein LOC143250874 isoform X1 n=2 Tax=Tachypleus tridentatus TaxID=6853 RepID=UPI003FD60049